MWRLILLRRLHGLNYKVGNEQITHLPRRRSSMKDLGGSEIPSVSRVLAHSSWWKTVPECRASRDVLRHVAIGLSFSVYWQVYHTHCKADAQV